MFSTTASIDLLDGNGPASRTIAIDPANPASATLTTPSVLTCSATVTGDLANFASASQSGSTVNLLDASGNPVASVFLPPPGPSPFDAACATIDAGLRGADTSGFSPAKLAAYNDALAAWAAFGQAAQAFGAAQ